MVNTIIELNQIEINSISGSNGSLIPQILANLIESIHISSLLTMLPRAGTHLFPRNTYASSVVGFFIGVYAFWVGPTISNYLRTRAK